MNTLCCKLCNLDSKTNTAHDQLQHTIFIFKLAVTLGVISTTLTWLCTCRNPPKVPGIPPAGAEFEVFAGALVGSAVGRVAEVVVAPGVLSVVASCRKRL